MKVTQYVHANGGTSDMIVDGDDFLSRLGAYVVNGLTITRRWVDAQEGDGFTLIVHTTNSGRVLGWWTIEQPVSPFAVGIQG